MLQRANLKSLSVYVSLLLIQFVLSWGVSFGIASMHTKIIRESVIAGTWYPDDPDTLRSRLNGFLEQVEPKKRTGQLIALIVPHAAYQYSGQIAAHAYKLLEDHRFDTVVISAPSHRARFAGVSVYDRGGYRTPLGVVPLDRELIETIQRKDPGIRYFSEAHKLEHSLEIQLPFIQVLLPKARLVPLVMGEQRLETCRQLASTLSSCIRGKSVLLVASTDLSHFHSYEEAKRLDARVIDRVKRMDAEGLYSDLASGRCEACGGGPMVATLLAARQLGVYSSELLSAANSGDVIGDRRRVVGYMAAALWAETTNSRNPKSENGGTSGTTLFTPKEKALLHRIARCSVEACVMRKDLHLFRRGILK